MGDNNGQTFCVGRVGGVTAFPLPLCLVGKRHVLHLRVSFRKNGSRSLPLLLL